MLLLLQGKLTTALSKEPVRRKRMPQALHTMGFDLEPWRHWGLSRAPQLSQGPAHGFADFLAAPPLLLATAGVLCVARLVLPFTAAAAEAWMIGNRWFLGGLWLLSQLLCWW
jgi:hypothetical protein